MSVHTPVPVGLATKLGTGGAALAAAFAALSTILGGDHTPETLAALISSAGLLYGVVTGRMGQAAAAASVAPAVAQTAANLIVDGQELAAVIQTLLDDAPGKQADAPARIIFAPSAAAATADVDAPHAGDSS